MKCYFLKNNNLKKLFVVFVKTHTESAIVIFIKIGPEGSGCPGPLSYQNRHWLNYL